MNVVLDWKRTLDLLLAERMQERLAFAARLLLLALLAVTLAGLTWRLLDRGEGEAPPAPPRSAAPAAQSGGNWNLARWHLFGQAPVTAAAPVETLPETRLNLTLRGVIAGKDGGAIIGTPNGVESFYGIDARLPGGATLREVYGDRVVLERSGRRETLRLPRDSLDAGSAVAAAAAPAAAEPQVLEPNLSLNQYRDLALQNPGQLADVVQVAPRNEGGRFLGYEVQPGRDPGLLGRVGLQPGDVVTSVNGIALDTPARALGVLRSLRGRNEVIVEIQRGGVPQTLSVNLQD